MEKKKNTPKLRFPEFTGEWEEKRLGEIAEIKSDKYNPEKNPINYKCIELEHLATDTGQLLGFINSVDSKSIKNKFETGDVLFGKLRPYLRKFLIAPFDGVCSSEIWVLNGKQITNWFLYYLIQTDCFLSLANQSTGSKMPRADWSVLSESYFNISNQEEQTKIATFLTAVDEKLTQLKKKKTLLEQYKKGIMQKLFSQELRFKDDNNQDFPDWEEKTLGEIVLITNGNSPSFYKLSTKGLYPFVKVDELNNCYKYQLFSRFYCNNGNNLVQTNSIIFPKRGAAIMTNKVRINSVPTFMDSNLMAISAINSKIVNIEFLYYFIVKEALYKIADTSTIPQINNKHIEPYLIMLPSLLEQQKIATLLSAIDEKISHCGKQIEKMEAWKKGLLQQMFC